MSRRSRQRRHHEQEGTKSRVPIIPMLDMAFQLLAFGLSTFDLSNIFEEGQFAMALPPSGDTAKAPSTDKLESDDEDFTLMVLADPNGRIEDITYTTTKEKDAKKLPNKLRKSNPDEADDTLEDKLAKLVEEKSKPGKEPPKLDAQFHPELNYQLVFEVLAATEKAKFKKVTPQLLSDKPPAEKPKTP